MMAYPLTTTTHQAGPVQTAGGRRVALMLGFRLLYTNERVEALRPSVRMETRA